MKTPKRVVALNDPNPNPLVRHAHRVIGAATRGTLDIHFATRTITYANVEGRTALQLIDSVSDGSEPAPALNGWDTRGGRAEWTDATARTTTVQRDAVLSIDWRPQRIEVADLAHGSLLEAAHAVVEAEPEISSQDTWSDELQNAVEIIARDMFPGDPGWTASTTTAS